VSSASVGCSSKDTPIQRAVVFGGLVKRLTLALLPMAVADADVAVFVRRLLRHPAFNARAKRMGAVIRASYTGITTWRLRAEAAISYRWSTT
jgi:hypothetical protein